MPPSLLRIQAYVGSPEYRALRSPYVLASLDRLVSGDEMRKVWAGMPQSRGLPDPLDFLITCEQSLSAWERMPPVTDRNVEIELAKLGDDANQLAKKLDQHAREIAYAGIPLCVANYVSGLSAQRRDRHGRHWLPYLYDPFGLVGPIKVQAVLRELAERLRASNQALRHPLRPKKRQPPKNAERTFLVRCLVDFFLRNGGDPHWEWVAEAVAAMTNSDLLDTRHIQGLVPDISPLFSDPGEELLWYNKYVWVEPKDIGDP